MRSARPSTILQRAHGYTPTFGMLLALADHPGATEFDYRRCQSRGLLDHRLLPTDAGRAVIQAQSQRMEARRG